MGLVNTKMGKGVTNQAVHALALGLQGAGRTWATSVSGSQRDRENFKKDGAGGGS